MKRPKKIIIAGQPFEIKYTDDVDSDTWGRTYLGAQRLEITDGLHTEQEQDTGLHEVLHAIIRILGLHRSTSIEEERLVGGLTPVLLATLKNNPKFTAWLLEKSK
jgi:hypothetical protein